MKKYLSKILGVTVIIFLIYTLYLFPNRTIRKAERTLDKLELSVPAKDFVNRLNALEYDLVQTNKKSILINPYKKIMIDNISFNPDTIGNLNHLSYSTGFKIESLRNIIEIYRIVLESEIVISRFQKGYHCNDQTLLKYKDIHCDNSDYCWRQLYIKRGMFDENCFDSDLYPVDSLGDIYLLKPKQYRR